MSTGKRVAALVAALGAVLAFLVATPASAQTGGNCDPYGAGVCRQMIEVNTVSKHTITVAYASGGNFYLPRATSGSFACGNANGIFKVYVHSGYNVRLQGYWGVNAKAGQYISVYFTSTGWHTLPKLFRSPYCNDSESGTDKKGRIYDALEYKQ